jgi:hypothetical protein
LNNRPGFDISQRPASAERLLSVIRFLFPVGWLLAAIGYYGPWIAHKTAALAITGIDLGEFVKFLPGALAGSLPIVRQLFYLPPLAIVLSVALLINSPGLRYPWPARLLALVLAVPVSLQLLPPAWSPTSLTAPEFRLQTIALGFCWLFLAGSWFLSHLPSWLSGIIVSFLAAIAAVLPAWQLTIAYPAIDSLYGRPPGLGWGFYLCLTGLATMAGTGAVWAMRNLKRSNSRWR